MILVKFLLRVPGQQQQIAKGKMHAVPREGDNVIINDVTRTVHKVEWNVTSGEVHVLLKE